jgi:DNA polymerase-3 subunit epsilon
VPAEAFNVHGLSTEFWRANRCLPRSSTRSWVHRRRAAGDSQRVVRHRFINAELTIKGRRSRDRLVDTLLLARRKHPSVSNRLDDLCSR